MNKKKKRRNVVRKTKDGLVKYNKKGRRLTNWVTALKKKSRRFLKDKCEECGTTENLTIHHKKEIRGSNGVVKGASSYDELVRMVTNEKNCMTLCRECHDEVHNIRRNKKIE